MRIDRTVYVVNNAAVQHITRGFSNVDHLRPRIGHFGQTLVAKALEPEPIGRAAVDYVDVDWQGMVFACSVCLDQMLGGNEMGENKTSLDRLTNSLAAGHLTDDEEMEQLDVQPSIQILPDANVVKIGGQSFIDRGRMAVLPLIDELVENLPHHKMIIGTGAGTRARHAYSVGLDLGMPTGVLSVLGFFVSIQNAKMIHWLLAKHGIPQIEPAQFAQLPLYLAERRAVVSVGMPPYAYWQPNPEVGRIPPHRTDAGCYLIIEVLGARSMIYVKDEEGLYTADPKKDQNANFIPKITVDELLELDLADVALERTVDPPM